MTYLYKSLLLKLLLHLFHPAPITVENNLGALYTCSSITDSLALVDLYNATNGANWTTTWNLNQPTSTWFGVNINNLGCVDQLDLSNNNLIGTIPTSINTIYALTHLQLNANQLSDTIPDQLGSLLELQLLYLQDNQLSGSIPSALGNLSNLEELRLGNNQLSGSIPTELDNLADLSHLQLQQNQLTGGIPNTLGNLTKLEFLYLQDNQLNGAIPATFGNLTLLNELRLWGNELTGSIPIELGNLSSMSILQLHNNQLSGSIPAQLGNLNQLIYLQLHVNQLTGSIPSSLGNLSNLEFLYLQDNQLSGAIPDALGNLTQLLRLFMHQNNLTNSIPASLGNLTALELLGLQDNDLSGTIPSELGSLTSLNQLFLQNNQLTGDIPEELGNLSQLIQLRLENNQLSGGVPASLGNLTNLTQFLLNQNQLTGAIPSELGNLSNLELLYLQENQLSGTIPTTLGNLSLLQELRLSDNELTGNIPSELGNLTMLDILQLQDNQLSGNIPTELGNLNQLTFLQLHTNQLTGAIPASLGNLTKLEFLYLQINQLSGAIPATFGDLDSLSFLYLQNNQLTGAIPEGLGNLSKLTQLRLSSNNLSGCFPASFNSICSITYDFTNNPRLPWEGDFQRFCNSEAQIGASCNDGNSSTITDFIQANCSCSGGLFCRQQDSLVLVDLQNAIAGIGWNLNNPINTWSGVTINATGCVESISLNSGGYTGIIPVSIGDLSELKILELYENNLSDTLPKELGQLSKLEQLKLYDNNFTGNIPPELSFLTKLTILDVHNNSLSGNIPEPLGSISQLDVLNLNTNSLAGSIPATLEDLDRLSYLNLSQNNLSGTLPPELGQLASLNSLYLNDNNLSGCIPSEFANYCAIVVELQNNPSMTEDDFAAFCNSGTGACLENDNCTDAILLPMNLDPCGINTKQVILDGAGSTDSPYGACASSFGNKDVWFKAVVPSTGNLLIRKDSATNIRLYGEAYLGCPNGPADTIACAYMGEKPNVLAIDLETTDAGQEVFIRVWDSLDLVVSQAGIATAQISAHQLSEDPENWRLCDFKESSVGAADGEGTRKANEFIVQYKEGATEAEKNAIRQENGIVPKTEGVEQNYFRECRCANKEIEIWVTGNPIETETKRKKVAQSNSGRQDTTGYNYIIALPTSFDNLNNVQANTHFFNDQDKPSLATDETGNFVATWTSIWQDGGGKGIFGQRFNEAGKKLGAEFMVNTYTPHDQDFSAIAMADGGQFVVVWTSDLQDGDLGGIYGQRFHKNGYKLGSEFRINTNTANSQNSPAIAMNDIGRFVVIWQSNHGMPPLEYNVFGQLYTSTGTAIGSEFQVNISGVTTSAENPDVAMNSAGDYVVVWHSIMHSTGDPNGIYAQRFDKYGVPVGSEFQVNTYSTNNQINPAAAMDEVGNFVLTWESETQDGDAGGIYAQRYDRYGTAIGGEFKVNAATIGNQTLPKASMDKDGRFVITWKTGDGAGEVVGVYAQRYDRNGTPIGTNFLVKSETMDDQDHSIIALDEDQDIVVSWTSIGQDNGGKGVFFQQYLNSFYQDPIQTASISTEGVGIAKAYGNNTYIPIGTPLGSVVVTTLDSGIDEAHPQFEHALWHYDGGASCTLNEVGSIGIDLINEDDEPDDLDEHGTAVNGVIVNEFPNELQLDVMNVKFFENNNSTLFDAICGIYYAVDQGADIINLSWGFESSEFPALLQDALEYAQCQDVIIVTSAGNSGKNNSSIPKYPANLGDENTNIITVGAYETDYFGQNPMLSQYSNFGNKVDLAALGFVETTTADSTFGILAGTSLAAPAVARVAAMIRAYYPNLNALEIKDCILSSVDVIGLNVRSGGILNESAALNCADQKVSGPCISKHITLNANVGEESCAGNDGLIDLIVGGTEQNPTFAWSNSATAEDLVDLAADIYTVTATDECGCIQTLAVEVQNECTGGDCEIDRTIDDDPLIGSIYRASNTITSNAAAEAGVVASFQAGQEITLRDSFHAQNGATFTATIEDCTPNNLAPPDSLGKPSTKMKFFLSPNPAGALVNLQYFLPESGELEIALYNPNGRLIKTIRPTEAKVGEWNTTTLSIEELENGIYWVQMRNLDVALIEKLVVAK